MGYPAVCLTLVVLGDEYAFCRMGNSECSNDIQYLQEAPSVNHFWVCIHIDPQVDRELLVGEQKGQVLGQSNFGGPLSSFG
jgi:hypothetical protein